MFKNLLKTEHKCSHVVNQAFNKAMTSSLAEYNQIKSITLPYFIKIKCSVQVHLIMLELWLQKAFPAFSNISLIQISPENIIEFAWLKVKQKASLKVQQILKTHGW